MKAVELAIQVGTCSSWISWYSPPRRVQLLGGCIAPRSRCDDGITHHPPRSEDPKREQSHAPRPEGFCAKQRVHD